MQKIIDTHIHKLDLDRFRLPWLDEVPELNHPILLDQYAAAQTSTDQYKVIGAVHIELDTAPSEKRKENDYFVDLAAANETVIKCAAIYADMKSPQLREWIEPYVNRNGVSSVRYVLHVPSEAPGTCLTEQFVNNVKMLGECGLQFEGCFRTSEIMDFYELVRRCPKTAFILNHMGLPDLTAWTDEKRSGEVSLWQEGIEKLAELPNITCKISGLSSGEVTAIRPLVEWCLNKFGPDRIMFASNFPVCNLNVSFDDWTLALLDIFKEQPEEIRDQFFYKNAIKIYHLSEEQL
ncbi:MAG: amidohydrolase family protein [Lachnospiraceae bacterium]